MTPLFRPLWCSAGPGSFSSTVTFRPAAARWYAVLIPTAPAPITITSASEDAISHPHSRPQVEEPGPPGLLIAAHVAQAGFPEVRAAQVGAAQVRGAQVGIAQLGAVQVRVAELCAAQVRAHQARPVQPEQHRAGPPVPDLDRGPVRIRRGTCVTWWHQSQDRRSGCHNWKRYVPVLL